MKGGRRFPLLILPKQTPPSVGAFFQTLNKERLEIVLEGAQSLVSCRYAHFLCPRASRLPHFAPKIRRVHHYRPAHFKQARPHPRTDAIRERIFFYSDALAAGKSRGRLARRGGLVKIIRGENRHA